MKNKEKFAKEIVEIAIKSRPFCVGKDGKIIDCWSSPCRNCIFSRNEERCWVQREAWAESEYVEPKVFTEKEKAILIALPKANWVARDESGEVFLYTEKPIKKSQYWFLPGGGDIPVSRFSDAKFESVKWEDIDPTSRGEILK